MAHRSALSAALAAFILVLSGPLLAAGGDEAPAKKSIRKVTGPCASPRAAIATFQRWMEMETPSPARAATCFDKSHLKSPSTDAPALAQKLKKLLDVRGLELLPDSVSNDPDYVDDANTERFRPFPQVLAEIALVKNGDRWQLSAASLDALPKLYRQAFPLGMDDIIESLPSWTRWGLFGVELWQLIGVVLLWILAIALQKLVVALIGTYLRRLVGKLKVSWVQPAVERSSRPIGGLVMALVFTVGFPILQFSARANAFIGTAVTGLAAFSAIWLGYRLIDIVADVLAAKADKTDTKLDDQLVPLFRTSAKAILMVVGFLFILQNLNVDVGSLLAGLGLGGLAFALAAKDTIANFFGSLMIFVDKPFQIGDWIKMGGVEGTVEAIGFRTSRIRTFYNSVITLPNARVTGEAVDNLGLRQYRRYKSTLGLTYDTPPEKMQAFCEGVRGIIQAMPGMRKDFYLVEFTDYGAHSLNILLYCFMESPTWADELRTRTNLNLEVLRLAERMGVEFAYPTQTLHVSQFEAEKVQAAKEMRQTNEPSALGRVIRAFGPGGSDARSNGVELGINYDPQTIQRGDDDSGE